MIYKLIKDFDGVVVAVMRNGSDTIPFDPANTDYKEYLKWLEEGNTPEPAEQGAE